MTVYTPPRFAGEAVRSFLDQRTAEREAADQLASQAFAGASDYRRLQRQYDTATDIAKRYKAVTPVAQPYQTLGDAGSALIGQLFSRGYASPFEKSITSKIGPYLRR